MASHFFSRQNRSPFYLISIWPLSRAGATSFAPVRDQTPPSICHFWYPFHTLLLPTPPYVLRNTSATSTLSVDHSTAHLCWHQFLWSCMVISADINVSSSRTVIIRLWSSENLQKNLNCVHKLESNACTRIFWVDSKNQNRGQVVAFNGGSFYRKQLPGENKTLGEPTEDYFTPMKVYF